jgi:hypothetical protein
MHGRRTIAPVLLDLTFLQAVCRRKGKGESPLLNHQYKKMPTFSAYHKER